MVDNNGILAEIEVVEDQQRLTEREEIEIQRHARLMEVQCQFAATLQADLDALRLILRSAAPLPQPGRPTNGNGHDKAHELMAETMVSGDQA